jgi:hypothetical protein
MKWKLLGNKIKEFGKLIERIDGLVRHAGELIKYLWWVLWVAVLFGLSTCTPSRPRELPISPPQIVWCKGATLESNLLTQGKKRHQMQKREIRDGDNIPPLLPIRFVAF